MSNLVHEFAFGTPKFYIAPYGKINHGLVNMSSNCDVKLGLSLRTRIKFVNCVSRMGKIFAYLLLRVETEPHVPNITFFVVKAM